MSSKKHKCKVCGKKGDFCCRYCGAYFCIKHHLPENHNCGGIPQSAPLSKKVLRKESRRPVEIKPDESEPRPPTFQIWKNEYDEEHSLKRRIETFIIRLKRKLRRWKNGTS
jgi:hypothetical protein